MPAKGAKKQPDGTWLVPDEGDAELLEQVEHICPACFPHGWPDEVTRAGCVHGEYARELPEEEGDE